MLTNQDLQAIQDTLAPRFDKIDERFVQFDERFVQLQEQFSRLRSEFEDFKEDFRLFKIQNDGEHNFLLKEIQAEIANLHGTLRARRLSFPANADR